MFTQVKVILRVCPPPPLASEGPLRAPLLRIDQSKKRVTVVEPTWNSLPRARLTQRREERAVFKTYAFDAVYPQETGQVWRSSFLPPTALFYEPHPKPHLLGVAAVMVRVVGE